MSKIVPIAQSAEALTPAQKQFNTLLKKINTAKKTLADWQEVSLVQQQKASIINPLFAELREQQGIMARALDELYGDKLFKKKDQEKIAYLICDLCMPLIGVEGYEDFKALYNQYSEVDFDTEQAESQVEESDMMKAMFEAQFGAMDEVDFSDPEKVLEAIAAKISDPDTQEKSPKKRTAKQLAQDAKAKEEEAHVSKSIQAVYRQLVGALHPDRELDPVERDRKTELMQRITVAYKKKDLLQLLELQLSVEQIEQHAINRIADDRLKHFNKVLKDQLNELEMEVHEMKMCYGQGMQNQMLFSSITPKRVIASFDTDIKDLRRTLVSIKQDRPIFADPHRAKAWLKEYQIPEENDMYGDLF